VANTTGKRNLGLADTLVAVVERMHVNMAAVVTVMENPARPGKLPGRAVAGFLQEAVEVDYCAYGGRFFKRTQLWCGPAAFDLVKEGFQARNCAGGRRAGELGCPLLGENPNTGKYLHPAWEGTALGEREAIPFALSRAIGIVIAKFLSKRQGSMPSRRRQCCAHAD
jgi:hypothetical protein